MEEKGVFLNNEEICQVIKTYLDEDLYRYALLLDGEWGCGKTYFVQQILKDHVQESRKMIYVSLYGIRSVDELRNACADAILASFFETNDRSETIIDFVRVFGLTMIKQIPVLGDVLNKGIEERSDLIEKFGKDKALFVFDDLERCLMSVCEILGYINRLVECCGYKVLIVANEEECKNLQVLDGQRDLYDRTNEKLIGCRLKYRPDLKEIAKHILEQLNKKNSSFMSKESIDKFAEKCEKVMRVEKVENIRILQAALMYAIKILNAIWTTEIEDAIRKDAEATVFNAVLTVAIRSRIKNHDFHWNVDWEIEGKEYGYVCCLSSESIDQLIRRYIDYGSFYFMSFRFIHEYVQSGMLNENDAKTAFMKYVSEVKSGKNQQPPKVNTFERIEMNRIEGLCIGQDRHDGCKIISNKIDERVTMFQVDFSKTEAGEISLVYHLPEQPDWRKLFDDKKALQFSIFADPVYTCAKVEFKLYNRGNIKLDIDIERKKRTVCLPFVEFCNARDAWSQVKEIDFVFKREKVRVPVTVVIEDLRIVDSPSE